LDGCGPSDPGLAFGGAPGYYPAPLRGCAAKPGAPSGLGAYIACGPGAGAPGYYPMPLRGNMEKLP